MTDRLAVVTRLALLALANFYSAGKVTIVDYFRENSGGDVPTQVVNVDVTGRAELRDQLADAIIDCDVYHVHEPKCYPWEAWTSDGGTQYRGLVGQLLTMWVRIEEIVGYVPQPVASDPAAVPGVPAPAPTSEGDTRWLDTGAGWGYDVPRPRPPVVDELPTFAEWKRAGRPYNLADMPSVGIHRVDPATVKPDLTPQPSRLAVMLDDPETARLLTDAAMQWPVPAEVPSTGAAWRKWAMHAIETDLRTGGPFPTYAAALAAVRAHPAVKSVEPDDVINLAYGLVAPPAPRPRAPWWTFGGMLRTPGVAE